MNEQISNKIIQMIENAASKGEEGIKLLIEKFPSVLEGYVNWLLFDAVFSFLFVGAIAIGAGMAIRIFYRKHVENPPQNSWDTTAWQVWIGISAVSFAIASILLVTDTAINFKRFAHFKLSPATAVYQEFIQGRK